MKGYAKYIKWLVSFIFVMVPTLVFGEDTGYSRMGSSSPLWDMFQNLSFTPPVGDLSVSLLVKMFGFVPGVPQFAGAQSTILGTVFGVFNAGILALSGVFLTYTITKILTETTMDGAAMGKSTTIWTAVRCALSTSLLVPQASGYSMVNSIIMWVVVQSIGLADLTWNRAMDYLNSGGGSYSITNPFVDYSLIDHNVPTSYTVPGSNVVVTAPPGLADSNTKEKVGAADVLRSLTCSHVVLAGLRNRQTLNRSAIEKTAASKGAKVDELDSQTKTSYYQASTLLPETSTNGFSVYKDYPATCAPGFGSGEQCTKYQDGLIQFPYVANEGTIEAGKNPYAGYGLLDQPAIPTNLTGICGVISYGIGSADEGTTTYAKRANNYIESKHQGLLGMIAILEPVARELVKKMTVIGDKGEVDPAKKRVLDPYDYVVFTDAKSGAKYKFLINPADPVPYSSTNLTSSSQRQAIQITSSVAWPLGADELLNAAANYQSTLATAQTAGANTVSTDTDTAFTTAKKQGWITAGNYYRLLATAQAAKQAEYGYYRLTGYKNLSTPIPVNDSTSRDNYPGSDTLFLSNVTAKPALDALWGSKGDKSLINYTMNWIYLVYPYSQLHGEMLTTVFAETGASTDLTSTLIPTPWFPTEESTIWGRVVGGSVLLALAPPLALTLLMDPPMDFLKLNVSQIFADWNTYMGAASAGTGARDPILKLQLLGTSMVNHTIAYVSQLKGFLAAIAVATSVQGLILTAISWGVAVGSILGATVGASEATDTTLSFYKEMTEITLAVIFMQLPIALAMLGPIFITGIIFSLYVPLIPYLLFLFGAISWFISVLVLMAAAPIICFLMLWGNSSQENPLLAREAEQFIMQVVGVFFRPILMVIGLITGMVLSYIGVDLLNAGFTQLIAIIQGGKTLSTTTALSMIQQVGIVVIYTFTMVSIVNMCFSTIHLLYSEAMRVVGIQAPAVGMEEKGLEGVKGAVSQFGEAGGAGMKEGATSLKGAGIKSMGAKDSNELAGKRKDKRDKKEADKAAKKNASAH